jgi:iron complex outermembrane receptor protein
MHSRHPPVSALEASQQNGGMNRYTLTPIACALTLVFHPAAAGPSIIPEQRTALSEVVVTAPQMSTPLTVVTDPKAPRQPVPAHDGADYLKTIPGFSVIRKGGADGDPVLRGMAGSRLNITADGQTILGGCGSRMDPPTAYIFPAEYDKITVIKGPQTVLYGPVGSAGTVLFERSDYRMAPGLKFNSSIMGGSYGRSDQVAGARYSLPNMYLQADATRSHSDDYRDGSGAAVHSAYTRWSSRAAIGLTPDDDTLIELSVAKSDGRAAYADRRKDGARFSRQNIGLKFEKRNISPLVEKVEAQIYRNYVDHVMDNYTLRTPPDGMYSAMNPDRLTEGGRVAVTLRLADATQLIAGIDMQSNRHTTRMGMGMSGPEANQYRDQPRKPTANFQDTGVFGELTQGLGDQKSGRIVTGWRIDSWRAEDTREETAASGVTRSRDHHLNSSFARYERDLDSLPMTLYAGVGTARRFPDYWELVSKESTDAASAFNTKPEKTKQFDIGALYRAEALTLTASAFYNRIDDFILIQSHVTKGSDANVTLARNVDASTWGGELGAAYALSAHWKLEGSFNYVRGENLTDGTVLAQMPPLETRFGLNYDDRTWSTGAMLRTVAAQNRFDLNKGNIAGQDLGPSAGFTIFSINAGWKPSPGVLISAGIDNLTNKVYAEHLSRGGATVPGYEQTSRVNEPGRMIWLKAQIEL